MLRFRGTNSNVRNNQNNKLYPKIKKNEGAFCIKCGCWKGSLGQEPSFTMYVENLCSIMDECKRVLKKTGSLWVNIADTYAGSGNGTNNYTGAKAKSLSGKRMDYNMQFQAKQQRNQSVPDKSLCLIPFRFATAMVDRGWTCRNDIAWDKANCLPSPADDRFTVSWEHLFFFTKSNRY
ncbi:MAG: DNA methyltransferase [bacterium]|nr:DNA methyltransferase [bacterium]